MPRKLENIELDEISLVDAAANRKKFFILKRRESMDELIKLLKSMMGEDAKDEELEKAKQLSEEAGKALKGALNILNKYKDDMPDDVVTAIKVLAKYASYGYPEAKQKSDELSKEDIEKIGARLSKATLEQLKTAKEVLAAIDLKSLKKVSEIIDKLISESSDVAKRADLSALPQDVREKVLKAERIEQEGLQKAADERIAAIVKSSVEALIKPLQETVDKLAKTKGIKKSLDGQVDDDPDHKGKDEADKWPSLSGRQE
jgi:hypothetical protein